MGKWADRFKELNEQRKRGLKNPLILWSLSFIITFILTIFPSMFLQAFTAKDFSVLFDWGKWTETIIANLYPMVITQSVVTALQNRSVSEPIKEKQKTKQYGIRTSWTTALSGFVILYVFGYMFFFCSSFPWRNLALYVSSGIVTAVGLASVMQLEHEKDKIRQAIERESRGEQESQDERAQRVQEADRDLGGNDTPPAQLAPPENSAGREGPLPKDGAAV